MSTILVTGGAGYIGSHMALALLAEGHKVIVLDNLSTGSEALVPQKATFVKGDIEDARLVETLLRKNGVEEIFHFAAFVDVAESIARPLKYHLNNMLKTGRFLFSAKRAGVQRFVFSSTAAVYGNPDEVPTPEGAPTRPVSPYGESKLKAEELVRGSGLHFAILRYFNVAGADILGRSGYSIAKEPTHLIRRAVRAALGDIDHLDVFGTDYPTPDGSAVRDYIHVSDLVQAHLDVLRYLQKGGRSNIFNVGYGFGHSVLDVVDAIQKITSKPLPVRYAPRREGDPMIIIANSKKLLAATGWKPKYTSLGGMIIDEMAWVKLQKEQKK